MKIQKPKETEIDGQSLQERLKEFRPAEGHSMPVTRREFLAAGLIPSVSAIFLPNILHLLSSSEARAEVASMPAYFEVWASGGACFPANVMMTDIDRQPLKSYVNCGQGNGLDVTRKLPDNVTGFFANSVPVFANSGFYKSFSAVPGISSALANSYLYSIPANLLSDSAANIMSAQGLIQASVAPGKFMPYLQNTKTFNPPAYLNPPSPLQIVDYANLQDAVAARSGDSFLSLPKSTQSSVSNFIQKLSVSQAKRFSQRPGGASLQQVIELATGKVSQLSTGAIDPKSFDPRNDPKLAALWNISGKPNNASEVVEASIALNVAKGNAVSGSLVRGGYDYHIADRNTINSQDKALFDLVAKLLQTLEYFNRPGIIQIVTDGSCYGNGDSTTGFPGDSNNICCAHFIVYHPNAIKMMTRSGGALETQIGQFTAGGIADQGPASAAARGIAIATYLNFMALAGLSGHAPNLINDAGLSPKQIAEMTMLLSLS